MLGQALSSLRGLQEAAQPGANAVQLLPPEPQVLVHALVKHLPLVLSFDLNSVGSAFAGPACANCLMPRELPDAARRAQQLSTE